MATSPEDITRLLGDIDAGREGAMDELMRAVYSDLNRLAAKHLEQRVRSGQPGITLEPAALVNEAFLRLIKQRNRYDNRGHFFAVATRVMLRVLVDYQRRQLAAKRGGGKKITLHLDWPAQASGTRAPRREIEVERLVEALSRLEQLDARKADVVKLRVVWGLKMSEIARSLGLSLATVERDWAFSKAWLLREAGGAPKEVVGPREEASPRSPS